MKNSGELYTELKRKLIHLLIALVPAMAAADYSNTSLFLMGGILFYATAESLRFLGFSLPIISSVTASVSRKSKKDEFALGPVTLGLGALLSLLLFPPQTAAAAIYALAFGDSASLLVGRFFGHIRPSFLQGKSLEGIFSCFAASALAGYMVFHDLKPALAVGAASLIVDVFPVGDFDNLLMPLASGLAAMLFFAG